MEGEGISHRTLEVNGIRMHVADKGEGPAVLLLHGFLELWYSWRHRILRLAARGYRAVAPDLRGYGDTSGPPSAASYSVFHIVGDLVALLDALAIRQEPGVVEGDFARIGTGNLLRRLFSHHDPQSPAMCKEEDSAEPEQNVLPTWLSEEDINYFTSKFEKSGFTDPLDYYRCLNLNWELGAARTGIQIKKYQLNLLWGTWIRPTITLV